MSSLRKDLSAGQELRRQLRKALSALCADLSAAAEGSGAHIARKRLKLSRGLLRMMRPAIGEEVFRREDDTLRQVSHALAPLRHKEAMGEAIRKLASSEGVEAAVIQALADAIERLELSEATATNPDRIAAALVDIEGLRARTADWPLPKRDIRMFAVGMQECYARARKRLREGLATGEVTLLHDARKSIIHHYHHLDLLKPLWPKLLAVWQAELHQLREALGDLNDLDELDGLLARGGITLADPSITEAASRLIGARREHLTAEIGKDSGHLFAESPRCFGARMTALWEEWQA